MACIYYALLIYNFLYKKYHFTNGILNIMLFLYLMLLKGSKNMPRPIKDNKNFEINRSVVYNGKDNNYHMASMSACTDH